MATQRIHIDGLEPGPIRYADLPPLVERIGRVRSALADVYPESLEGWLDDFRRDADPEREVLWWELLARRYLAYSGSQQLSAEQKRAAFRIIFGLASGSRSEDFRDDLVSLPQGALAEIEAILRTHEE